MAFGLRLFSVHLIGARLFGSCTSPARPRRRLRPDLLLSVGFPWACSLLRLDKLQRYDAAT